MVDRLTVYPNAWGPFRGGSCHLTSTSIDVLHRFALRLGLRREWFQDHRVAAHYDLTKGKRRKAIELGAIEVPMRMQIRLFRWQSRV